MRPEPSLVAEEQVETSQQDFSAQKSPKPRQTVGASNVLQKDDRRDLVKDYRALFCKYVTRLPIAITFDQGY